MIILKTTFGNQSPQCNELPFSEKIRMIFRKQEKDKFRNLLKPLYYSGLGVWQGS